MNYAEARNESVGPDVSVYDAVNAVRERNQEPYLPKLKEGLSKDEMRKAIRRERRVELAFEDKRRFDLLRWKIAEEVYSQGLQAMRIEEVNGRLKYTVIQAPDGKRKFESKIMYFQFHVKYWTKIPKFLNRMVGRIIGKMAKIQDMTNNIIVDEIIFDKNINLCISEHGE